MTVSALWSNSGIVHLLVDNQVISVTGQTREVLFPGLLAICCAFLIIGCVGTLKKKGPLPLLSFALGLANIHVLALYNDQYLGSSGIACNFMIVTVISVYLVAVRFANMKAGKKALPPEGKVSFSNRISRNHLVVSGILANIVSSSILCGKLLGTATVLFKGQSLWMFTSAAYQVAVAVASFWASDIVHATFFSLLAMLKFVEGYALLSQSSIPEEPLLPFSFMAVLAVLFLALSLIMGLQNVCIGLYTLLFAIYCTTLTLPSGINHHAPQAVNLVIFFASVIHMSLRLYLSKTEFKIPERKGLAEIINYCFQGMGVKPRIVMRHLYSPTLNSRDVDVVGHAFNTLATFSISVHTQSTFILVMASGSMVHLAGLLSLYTGKAAESSAFIFYGVLWVIWGLAKYIALQISVRRFDIAVGIICFLVLNGFLTACMTVLNKAWFINSLLLEALLIFSLLHTLDIVPIQCVVAFSILFGVVSFYCFLVSLVNGTMESPNLPWGKAFLKPRLPQEGCTAHPISAKKVTAIKKIAELMKSGGICVIPVDLGYAVASSCYFPDSVQKVSQLEIESEDNEISVFIAGLSHLRDDKSVLGRRVQGLIDGLWPNPVGFVLPKKGCWLDNLGLANSSSLLGSLKSITLCISDCEVTSQIINLVGPIAIRSLGKSTQALSDLGFPKFPGKVDGILFDGIQENDDTFTVVDCMQLENGIVNIIKEGSVPKTRVTEVLHAVITGGENGTSGEDSVRL
ncbi:uncharacterized protein ACMZJ9_013520 isoform 2-T2 [Mantella aurantiaca]